MKKLSIDNFAKAKKYIFLQGRALDQELFKYHFEVGSINSVMSELAKYQNEDGGFGHALEPDLRTPFSSALATSIALREMVHCGVNNENEILRKTISYLLESLDRDNWRWVIAPEERTNSPHAPWWGAEDIAGAFRGCIANPTAEITGYLLNYKNLVPNEILNSLLDRLQLYLFEATSPKGSFEMHDLICYLALYPSENLEAPIKEKFRPLLISQAERIVEKDKDKWGEYGARPLWLCDSPKSILYPHLREYVQMNLDFEIETQNQDGSWSPFWNWGDYHAEDWPKAKKDWSSHLTLKTLWQLKAFDRLEVLK